MKRIVPAAVMAAGLLVSTAAYTVARATQYELAVFTTPSGTFQHCFAIKTTGIYQSLGYAHSGTWVDTDFPDTAGTWLVFGGVHHYAGYVDGGAYLVIDAIGNGSKGANNATFDYFAPSGEYFAAGSLTAETDAACNQ